MNRISLFPLFALSGVVLSACNDTAYYYHSTGPWGPPNVYRTPPAYTAPWGQRGEDLAVGMIERRPFYIDGGGMDPVLRDVTPPPGRAEFILPPDPVVTRPRPQLDPYGTIGSEEPGPRVASPDQPVEAKPSLRRYAAVPPVQPVITAPTNPSSYAGSWRAVDNKGGSCRIQLSTAPTLGLYKASTSGCANPHLKSVNLWTFKGDAVTLFFREKVVAHLSGQEASLSGAMEGGQGGLKMSR